MRKALRWNLRWALLVLAVIAASVGVGQGENARAMPRDYSTAPTKPMAIKELKQLALEHPDLGTRRQARVWLQNKVPITEQEVEELFELISNPQLELFKEAGQALLKCKDPKFIPAIRQHHKQSRNWMEKVAATHALGELKDSKSMRALIDQLSSTDREEAARIALRTSAAVALGKIGNKNAIAPMSDEVEHGNRSVAAGLALFGKDALEYAISKKYLRTISALLVYLKDKPETKPFLPALLKHAHPGIQKSAAEALAELPPDPALRDEFRRLLRENALDMTTIAAIKALVRMGDRESIPDLIRLLNGPYIVIRETVINALGELKAVEAVPSLERMLPYRTSEGRAAADALEKITGRKYKPIR